MKFVTIASIFGAALTMGPNADAFPTAAGGESTKVSMLSAAALLLAQRACVPASVLVALSLVCSFYRRILNHRPPFHVCFFPVVRRFLLSLLASSKAAPEWKGA